MRTWIFFFISVLLNYGPDLAPYYVDLFAGDELEVIGSLTPFVRQCTAESEHGLKCAVEYAIPMSGMTAPRDSLGAGFFLGVVRAHCVQNSRVFPLEDLSDGETSLPNQYRVVNFQGRKCDEVILRNFVPPFQTRFGHSSGAVTVGKLNWVVRAKSLAEVFRKQLFLGVAATLLALFFATVRLRQLAHFKIARSPFVDVFPVWLIFVSINGGIHELVVPPLASLVYARKIVMFFGSLLVAYPAASAVGWRLHGSLLSRSDLRLKAILILAAVLVSQQSFWLYGAFIASMGVAMLVRGQTSQYRLLGLAYLSDAAKINNVTYFPESRVTIILIGFYILTSFLDELKFLANKIRDEAGIEFAERLLHDLQSPVGALNVALKMPDADSEARRDLSSAALARIREIASALALNSSTASNFRAVTERCDVASFVREILREKQVQNPQAKFIFEVSVALFCRADGTQLKRIFSNLIQNAIEAPGSMPRTVEVVLSKHRRGLVLSLSDNGLGFDHSILDRIGIIRVTTKMDPNGLHGTGSGLFFAARQLQAWGGKLTVENLPGTGAKVTVQLPVEV